MATQFAWSKAFEKQTMHSTCSSLAVFFNGLQAGALLFASRVSAKTLMTLVAEPNPNEELIRAFFPIWWPNGRDLMAPLCYAGTLFHFASWYTSGNIGYCVCGSLVLSVGLITRIFMLEDIQYLRNASNEKVVETTKTFCNKHHYRTFASLAAFGIGLYLFKNVSFSEK